MLVLALHPGDVVVIADASVSDRMVVQGHAPDGRAEIYWRGSTLYIGHTAETLCPGVEIVQTKNSRPGRIRLGITAPLTTKVRRDPNPSGVNV